MGNCRLPTDGLTSGQDSGSQAWGDLRPWLQPRAPPGAALSLGPKIQQGAPETAPDQEPTSRAGRPRFPATAAAEAATQKEGDGHFQPTFCPMCQQMQGDRAPTWLWAARPGHAFLTGPAEPCNSFQTSSHLVSGWKLISNVCLEHRCGHSAIFPGPGLDKSWNTNLSRTDCFKG